MAENDPSLAPRPGMTPAAEAERQARLEREAAALRANLRRRKEQVRTKTSQEPDAFTD